MLYGTAQMGAFFETFETGDYDDITTLAFHPNSEMLAAGSFNNTKVWLWSLADGHLLHTWEYPEHMKNRDRPYDLAFNLDGALLFAGCGTGGLRVWDVAHAQEVLGCNDNLWPSWITLSPDGQSLAIAHFDGVRSHTVRIVEIGTWRIVHELAGRKPSESFSSDGQLLVTLGEYRDVYLWQAVTGDLLLLYTV